jgi:hypothetical protein
MDWPGVRETGPTKGEPVSLSEQGRERNFIFPFSK